MDHPGSILDQFMIFHFSEAQAGAGTGLSLDQGRDSVWTRDGVCLGHIWVPFGDPFYRDPFRGIGRVPGTHLEAEGRHFGGRRPTFWRPKAD